VNVALVEIDLGGLLEAMCQQCAMRLLDAATEAMLFSSTLDPKLCVEDSALWREHVMAKFRAGQ
jgi:hypothetical protein